MEVVTTQKFEKILKVGQTPTSWDFERFILRTPTPLIEPFIS